MPSSSSSTAPAESRVTSNLHTLFTGIVFGLQPDALFVIVPALALPTKAAAVAYILMFVFGTVAAMGSYTAFIGERSRSSSVAANALHLPGCKIPSNMYRGSQAAALMPLPCPGCMKEI